MLIITRRVLSGGFSFATTRSKLRKDRGGAKNEEDAGEKDVFKAYRNEVEKGSVLRQFRQDVFRRAELIEDWDG